MSTHSRTREPSPAGRRGIGADEVMAISDDPGVGWAGKEAEHLRGLADHTTDERVGR